MKTALLCIAACVVGAVVARVTMPAPAREPASAPGVTGAGERCEPGVTRADLAALAAELRADRATGAALADTAAPADTAEQLDVDAPAPSPEAMEAADDAHDLVDRAIAAGEWTDGDVEQLRAMQSRLAGDDLNVVLGELIAAINEQRVVPTTPHLL